MTCVDCAHAIIPKAESMSGWRHCELTPWPMTLGLYLPPNGPCQFVPSRFVSRVAG